MLPQQSEYFLPLKHLVFGSSFFIKHAISLSASHHYKHFHKANRFQLPLKTSNGYKLTTKEESSLEFFPSSNLPDLESKLPYLKKKKAIRALEIIMVQVMSSQLPCLRSSFPWAVWWCSSGRMQRLTGFLALALSNTCFEGGQRSLKKMLSVEWAVI